jgi:hypothetical protein
MTECSFVGAYRHFGECAGFFIRLCI